MAELKILEALIVLIMFVLGAKKFENLIIIIFERNILNEFSKQNCIVVVECYDS